MTLRRVVVGLAMMCGLSVWSWVGADETPSHAAPAAVARSDGGNHDDAAHRYRTNQSNHWRHVMVGNH
jgi:hypothetical protein